MKNKDEYDMLDNINYPKTKGDIRANFEQLKSELRQIKYIIPIE